MTERTLKHPAGCKCSECIAKDWERFEAETAEFHRQQRERAKK